MVPLSKQLIEEFRTWFLNLAVQGSDLPKVFTGVKQDGAQFIVVLSDLAIGQDEHLDFMRTVLHAEDAVAFAYKIRTGVLADEKSNKVEERVTFFSGEQGHYFLLELAPKLDNSWASGVYETQNSESREIEIFFQDLLPEPYKPADQAEQYLHIWRSIRKDVMWRERL